MLARTGALSVGAARRTSRKRNEKWRMTKEKQHQLNNVQINNKQSGEQQNSCTSVNIELNNEVLLSVLVVVSFEADEGW